MGDGGRRSLTHISNAFTYAKIFFNWQTVRRASFFRWLWGHFYFLFSTLTPNLVSWFYSPKSEREFQITWLVFQSKAMRWHFLKSPLSSLLTGCFFTQICVLQDNIPIQLCQSFAWNLYTSRGPSSSHAHTRTYSPLFAMLCRTLLFPLQSHKAAHFWDNCLHLFSDGGVLFPSLESCYLDQACQLIGWHAPASRTTHSLLFFFLNYYLNKEQVPIALE